MDQEVILKESDIKKDRPRTLCNRPKTTDFNFRNCATDQSNIIFWMGALEFDFFPKFSIKKKDNLAI